MLNLPLQPTDDSANPVFRNPATCKKWLDQFQLTNLQAAHATLRAQLDEFNRFRVRGMDRLQTLEMLRETIDYVQNDFRKRVAGKALPLDENELAFFSATTAMWQSMFTGYLRCLQSFQEGEGQLASYASLLCHRSMFYCGQQIFDHLRAGYEFDGALWQQLHALYAFAEERNLLGASVQDELDNHDRRTSCRNIYLKILLSCHAQLQELTRPQQQLLDAWLSLWVAAIPVDRTFAISRGDAPPLAIDLAGTQGLQELRSEQPEENPNMRYLAMVPVSKMLRVKTILLQQGHTPKQLELGDTASSADCLELLTHLHKYWCEPRPQRAHERVGVVHKITLCLGLEDAYAFISSRPFNPMKNPALETWQTEEISLLGARLTRADSKGMRISANRIIATRAEDDEKYRLGYIVWTRVARNGQLYMGVRFFPNTPQAAIAKDAASAPGTSGSRIAAALLPAMENLGIPASLIIPRNVFKPDRLLEATITPGDERMKIKLGFSVEKGVDYERVSFTPA
jgi:cyclic-di-GMP-binding protein